MLMSVPPAMEDVNKSAITLLAASTAAVTLATSWMGMGWTALVGMSVITYLRNWISKSWSTFSLCPDINECESNIESCLANATCTNTEGSFICSCDPGYTGDGVNCTSRSLLVTIIIYKKHCMHTFKVASYFALYLQILMSVRWKYIPAMPMLTAVIPLAASPALA